MAQQVITRLVDDLDGSPADSTTSFGLDGRVYEIDLSAENAGRLADLIAPFKAAARRLPRTAASRSAAPAAPARPRADVEQTRAVRDWARRQGLVISDRGRIPDAILERYGREAGTPSSVEVPAGGGETPGPG